MPIPTVYNKQSSRRNGHLTICGPLRAAEKLIWPLEFDTLLYVLDSMLLCPLCVNGTMSQVRQSRDPEAAKRCLAAIEECARTREGNLLGLAVEAARARWATEHQHVSPQLNFPLVALDAPNVSDEACKEHSYL